MKENKNKKEIRTEEAKSKKEVSSRIQISGGLGGFSKPQTSPSSSKKEMRRG